MLSCDYRETVIYLFIIKSYIGYNKKSTVKQEINRNQNTACHYHATVDQETLII